MNRIGEKKINNFGSIMEIISYRKYSDIDVYFPEYDWTFYHAQYTTFSKGNIKCPYEPRNFGVGYIGEGEFHVKENNKLTEVYYDWFGMLNRVYNTNEHLRHPTYRGCQLDKEWFNMQAFGSWRKENIYTVKDEVMCLDKDILNKGNKIYSPTTCIYVPKRINNLFTKHDNSRGQYPVGVCFRNGLFQANCRDYNGNKIYLGQFTNPISAFNEYKKFKELTIKKVADEYKVYIPSELYNAMYNWEVDIND